MASHALAGLLGGLDPEQLKVIQGLLGATPEMKAQADRDKWISAGLGILGARGGNVMNAVGQGGLLGMQAGRQSLQDQMAQRQQAIQALPALQGLLDDQRYRKVAADYAAQRGGAPVGLAPTAPPADSAPGIGFGASPALGGMPPAMTAPRLSANKMSDYQAAIQKARYFEEAGAPPRYVEAAYAQAEKLRPEIKETRTQVDPATRQRVTVNFFKDGTTEVVPFAPDKEKAVQLDTGSAIGAVDPFTLQPIPGGGLYNKTMTPGEIATNKLGWARYGMEKDQAGKPQLVTDNQGNVFAVDPRAATGREVTGPGGVPLNKGDKPLTEVQGNATAFGMRMKSANDIINGLEDKGVNVGGLMAQLANSPITNPLASAVAQQARQAKLNFMTASLRKESGAAISESEFASEDRKYFPQPGDSAEVIKQKRQARALALKAMGIQAGPGAKNISGGNQKMRFDAQGNQIE